MSYKLTYFDIAARGEPARLIFTVAGVKFVDNRIKFEDWPALKSSLDWGQLPVLEFGDKTLTQSRAIYRYLARKFKLVGSSEWEAARCDELVDAMIDVVDEFVSFVFKEQDPAKKEEKQQNFYKTTLPAFLNRINKVQLENGGSFLVGQNLTWADITIVEYLRQLTASKPGILDGYPHVRKVVDAVESNEKIKEYRKAMKN